MLAVSEEQLRTSRIYEHLSPGLTIAAQHFSSKVALLKASSNPLEKSAIFEESLYILSNLL